MSSELNRMKKAAKKAVDEHYSKVCCDCNNCTHLHAYCSRHIAERVFGKRRD